MSSRGARRRSSTMACMYALNRSIASIFSALMPSASKRSITSPQLPELVLVVVRHAEQRADHHRRDLGREVLDEVEARAAALRVEELGAQLADPRVERGDAARA